MTVCEVYIIIIILPLIYILSISNTIDDKEVNVLNVQDKSHKDIVKLIEGLYPQDCLNEQTDNDNIVV